MAGTISGYDARGAPEDDANVEASDVECDGVRLWRVEYADGREDLTEQGKNAMDNATKEEPRRRRCRRAGCA